MSLRAFHRPLVCQLIVGALSLLFASADPYSSGVAVFMTIIGVLLLTGLLLLIVFSFYAYSEARKRHRAWQDQARPRRVSFSEKGVWEAGTYFPLNEILLDLKSVNLTSQPAVLHFKRECVHLRQANRRDTLRVLVPWGREEEAAQLMQRFRVEVIEARKRGYTPPEPS